MGLWNRGPEGCPQPKRAFGTRIWGHSCLRPFRAPHQSHPSSGEKQEIGVLLGLERKQVSVLALSFRESRDRVPCIHPAHGCPLSPAAGDGCFPAGVHWCYSWLRIHSTLWPLATPTTMHSSRLQPAFITPHTCPPPPFQPALCPRLQILVPMTVGTPPPPKLTQVHIHPSLAHVYGCMTAYGIVGACALGHLRARDSLPAHRIEAGGFRLLSLQMGWSKRWVPCLRLLRGSRMVAIC